MIIQSLNIDAPLYEGEKGTAQRIVDKKRSAAFIRWQYQNVIADHVGEQNFSNLTRAVPGVTVAIIEYENGNRERYYCIKNQVGHIRIENGKNKMYDSQWNYAGTQNVGGLAIYTCRGIRKGDIQDVTLTYWKRY